MHFLGSRSTQTAFRFIRGYFSASLAASATIILVQVVADVLFRSGAEPYTDLVDFAGFAVIYSLGFTLILGLVGWIALHFTGQRSATAYATTGLLLGALAAWFFESFTLHNPFLIPFALASVAAAVTFRHVFYRSAPEVRANAAA